MAEWLNALGGVWCVDSPSTLFLFFKPELPAKAIDAVCKAGKAPEALYCIALLDETGIRAVEDGKAHPHLTCLALIVPLRRSTHETPGWRGRWAHVYSQTSLSLCLTYQTNSILIPVPGRQRSVYTWFREIGVNRYPLPLFSCAKCPMPPTSTWMPSSTFNL